MLEWADVSKNAFGQEANFHLWQAEFHVNGTIFKLLVSLKSV